MTNDLKNFLEEESGGLLGAMLMSNKLPFSERKLIITTHDTRLINFVVDLLEKEVEKRFGDGSNEALVIIESTLGGISQRPALPDISTIIKSLKQ